MENIPCTELQHAMLTGVTKVLDTWTVITKKTYF